MPESSGRPRGTLSRDDVVAAAVRLVDDTGVTTLTMRRLATDLGVEAMALYYYVSGKPDLLDAVADELLAELDDDPRVLEHPEHGWQEFVLRLAHGVRRVALSHPAAFPLVASRPLPEPGLRAPLRSPAWTQRLLAALTEHGFRDDAATAAYRALTSFLLGHLLLEVGDGSGTARATEPSRTTEPLPADDPDGEFEASLEALLDHLERLRTTPSGTGGAPPPDPARHTPHGT